MQQVQVHQMFGPTVSGMGSIFGHIAPPLALWNAPQLMSANSSDRVAAGALDDSNHKTIRAVGRP